MALKNVWREEFCRYAMPSAVFEYGHQSLLYFYLPRDPENIQVEYGMVLSGLRVLSNLNSFFHINI